MLFLAVLQVDPSTEREAPAPPPAPPPELTDRLWHRCVENAFVARALAFRKRHARLEPAVFFFGGVAWDAATLNRIDAWFDNVFLLVYLAALGALILVAALVERGGLAQPWCLKYREWYPAAIQFFMGALFSSYTVFYFQSASLTSTSIFFVLLVGLLVANEFIHRRLLSLYLLFALYYFAAFSYFVFLVPILAKVMNYWTFLAGGVLSLGLVWAMLAFLRRRGVFDEWRQYAYALGVVAALFGLLNVFYVQDLMPPVPLAMRYGGVFHHVASSTGADGQKTYTLRYERPRWYRFWAQSAEPFRHAEGDRVYCFAAIFAPTRLSKGVYHEWRYYDEALGAWTTTDRMAYRITGYEGRDRGYRGYTWKRHVRPGRWRVYVRTDDGHTLGRVGFTVVAAGPGERVFTERVYE